jgi:hypothetical protein
MMIKPFKFVVKNAQDRNGGSVGWREGERSTEL